MPRYKTVLFDLDGTILDSIRLILDSFHYTFEVYGLPPRPEDELVRVIGQPLKVYFKRYSEDPAVVDAMVETYRAWNLEKHDAHVRVYAGIPQCVRALQEAGIRLGLVTSKGRHSAKRGLALAGLVEAFSVVICAEDVKNPKPHREPVDRALELLEGRPEEAIFIGDSHHDMHAGRSAEVATGAALWGPFTREDLAETRPSYWLERPEDILGVVMGSS